MSAGFPVNVDDLVEWHLALAQLAALALFASSAPEDRARTLAAARRVAALVPVLEAIDARASERDPT